MQVYDGGEIRQNHSLAGSTSPDPGACGRPPDTS